MPLEQMYTTQFAADKFHLCRHTIYKLIKDGYLEAVWFGSRSWRIPASELERIAKEGLPHRPSGRPRKSA